MSGSFLNTAPLPAFSQLNRIRIMRLYRRALKLQMSWTPRYDIFRGEAMELRRRFEANMHVTDPRMIARLVDDAEGELYRQRHPDPYIRNGPCLSEGLFGKWMADWRIQLPRLREDRNGNEIFRHMDPPNIPKDFPFLVSWNEDQRPYWKTLLTLPMTIAKIAFNDVFPQKPLPELTRMKLVAANIRREQKERDEKIRKDLEAKGITGQDWNNHFRWERLIAMSKQDINEWDWDALFADYEDLQDREALYLAVWDYATTQPRLRRERFHHEAMNRVDNLRRGKPTIEWKEFQAKELAIAACKGHISDPEYQTLTKDIPDSDSMISRDKLYNRLISDFFIPHLEKFKTVIEKRDDFSPLEQTRPFWRPKADLLPKLDDLLAISRLEKKIVTEEKGEWIWELYMAPKYYVEMERRPGEALEHVYWTQGAEYVPKGYKSPDELMWEQKEKFDREWGARMSEMRIKSFEEFKKRVPGDFQVCEDVTDKQYRI